jgi:hypothetical protein
MEASSVADASVTCVEASPSLPSDVRIAVAAVPGIAVTPPLGVPAQDRHHRESESRDELAAVEGRPSNRRLHRFTSSFGPPVG